MHQTTPTKADELPDFKSLSFTADFGGFFY
jgi:hypothetical protein